MTLSIKEETNLATEFWKAIYENMPEWNDVSSKKVKASEIRRDSLSPLSITLRSLGQIGNELIIQYPDSWKNKLQALKGIDWKKTNPIWQKGIIVSGSVQLSHATQAQMVNILKNIIK